MTGYAILGVTANEAKGPNRLVTIRLKNAVELARGQSALARAASLLPGGIDEAFIGEQTYEAVAEKIAAELAAQGAKAEVRVVDGFSVSPDPKTYFLSRKTPGAREAEDEIWKFARTYRWGVAAGVGLSGLALLLWRYLR